MKLEGRTEGYRSPRGDYKSESERNEETEKETEKETERAVRDEKVKKIAKMMDDTTRQQNEEAAAFSK